MRELNYLFTFLFFGLFINILPAQDFGELPKISKDSLLLDFELLKQGLEKYHTGIYWYTAKDSFDRAFYEAKIEINRDMNSLEFYKIIAPLVALTREGHTTMNLSASAYEVISKEVTFLPLMLKFLGTKLYCTNNLSDNTSEVAYKEIESINGETPKEIVSNIENLFATDGHIEIAKYNDLSGFDFSKYYSLYYGNLENYEVKFKNIAEPLNLKPLSTKKINENIRKEYKLKTYLTDTKEVPLRFLIISDSIAYLGVHTFANDEIKNELDTTLKEFLKRSFKTISEKKIETIIIDVSQNGGGSEGNEGLLYSYFGQNYQKYHKVKAKAQKVVLDNGVNKPITLKTYGFLERIFTTKKMPDGSLERRNKNFGLGLMAFKKEPKYKFKGKTVYTIISSDTYSGGSEFANMMYTQGLATFVGQETGGGYYGNTSGYSQQLTLPNSDIKIKIPVLQFKMNVEDKIPFGRGVIPDYKVIPSIEEYKNGENAPLNFILNKLIENS